MRDLKINFRDKSGRPVIGLMSAEIIEIEGEQYMLSLVKDITEQMRTKAEIKQLYADLALRASELEIANEELVAFNYSVSHELRQPLHIIGTVCQAIELLCGDKLDEGDKKCLKIASNEIEHMSTILESLLRFSHYSHSELYRIKVDLGIMARIIASNLRVNEPERQGQVTFNIAEGLMANCDPELLNVVLESLLGNAWKYTGKQSQAVIELGTANNRGTVAFFVRDNGPGFSKADAEKLFIPFKCLPGAMNFEGHGIGLATVERIIRRHGGKVWAEGEPDKGATVYFTLGQ